MLGKGAQSAEINLNVCVVEGGGMYGEREEKAINEEGWCWCGFDSP